MADAKVEDFKWPHEYQLMKPVQVKGEDVKFLILREPTTEDMIKHNVLNPPWDGADVINMICDLTGATPVTLSRSLHPKDFFALRTHLARFFNASVIASEGT